jgi:hypothetical protein
MLEVNYPMDNGIVRSWEDMHHVWHHTFLEKMQINPQTTKVMPESSEAVDGCCSIAAASCCHHLIKLVTTGVADRASHESQAQP